MTAGAAVAITLVVSLVFIGAGGPGSKDASAQVEMGARATLAEHTVAMEVSGSLTANGQSIPMSGSGFADLSSRLETLTMSFSANGTAVQETVLADGPSAYMQVVENDQNAIAQLLPGKHWVEMPLGASASSVLGAGTPNILSQLQLLTQQGNAVVSLGSSTINGEAVTGYQVTITHEAMVAASKRLLAKGGAEAQEMRALLSSISMEPPVIEVWLGADHLLRREKVSMSASSIGNSVSGDVEVDFSNYGSPVTVSIPAAGDVATYSDFLAAANAAG